MRPDATNLTANDQLTAWLSRWTCVAPLAAHPKHRYGSSTAPQKVFTISLECCSPCAGIGVHVALERAITMTRNMQLT